MTLNFYNPACGYCFDGFEIQQGLVESKSPKKILAKHQQRILVNREYLETNFAIICQEVRRSINKHARSPV